MAKEIERKYLVKNQSYRSLGKAELYQQGYLANASTNATLRIRTVGEQGFLTIKGPNTGISRDEYEYVIPLNDANEMLERLCQQPLIKKYRYKVDFEGFIWEVDEFLGENEGLVIAEVELPNENTHPPLPDWIGIEVSQDKRYYNSNLVKNPFKNWSKN